MKFSELEHGEISPFAIRIQVPLASAQRPRKGDAVHLRSAPASGDPILAFGGTRFPVECDSDTEARALKRLLDMNPARLCWLADTPKTGETSVVTLMVHRFGARIRLEEALVFGVDERIIARVEKRNNQSMTLPEVITWLEKRIILPPHDGMTRVVATGSMEAGARFRLLGRGIAVDIKTDDDRLVVDRVVTLRQRGDGFRPLETLLEAKIQFVDATAMGKARHAIRAQLDQIVAQSDLSYLALWEQYQVIERTQLIEKARTLGWIPYKTCRFQSNGAWSFKIADSDADAFAEFQARWVSGQEPELEAGATVPADLLGLEPPDTPSRHRVFIGTVDRMSRRHHTITLCSPDKDSETNPPLKGFIFAGLLGNRVSLKRRDEAVKRLRSADAGIPQLGLILEGQPAPNRRVDALRPLSAAATDVFAFGATPAQKRALDLALNTPDIAIIQGPPGTGKTTVIAALQVRFAEIEAQRDAIGGRTLLTSFQHDAVDNAVNRSQVFGLPPARFGGRFGTDRGADHAERWVKGVCGDILARLSDFDEDRPLQDYRRFRDRVASYAAGQLLQPDIRQLLADLLELDAGILPTDLWNRLKALAAGRRSRAQGLGLDDALNLKRVRGIPTQNPAFEDGGSRNCRRALTQLDAVLTPEEAALLQRASWVALGAPFPEIAALATLRDTLLDRLMPEDIPGPPDSRNAELSDVLNRTVAVLHQRMSSQPGGRADALKAYEEALRTTPDAVADLLQQYSAAYAATCQQSVAGAMRSTVGPKQLRRFENIIVDEAARANPLDLFIPISLGERRVILVGDHRQLPHMLEPEVERELAEDVSPEREAELKTSLFERLYTDLRNREQADGICRVITLDQQFRMHPTLGGFVSDTFYKPHGETFASPRQASEFDHDIDAWTAEGRALCAGWKDIPHTRGGEVRRGTSWARPVEAEWIAGHIRDLLDGDVVGGDRSDCKKHGLTVGVITFYKAQTNAILDAMARKGLASADPETGRPKIAPAYKTLERDGAFIERLRVGTVDSFQGMEFDVVILSVVRSNTVMADTESLTRRKFGHLRLPNRLCVAMSRQKRLLIAVGDRAMIAAPETGDAPIPGLTGFLELCGGVDGLVC